ncbi:MAG TPA: inorganic triphosphatase, partial [Noviherbaspirillum sp.]|uniref:CYTH and CHAD domain-containing protein n=1 Tax=Noviherbaspirillum sp. TaxID=1926288 RepID=UPI002DDD9475
MEIELKLLISPEHVETLRKHPLLEKHAVKNPRVQELVSTYFDTPTFEIRRCDAALRVRQVNGDNWIQTLKGGGKVEAGLHQNNEWECRVESAAPDLAALRDLVEPGTQWYALLQTPALSERLLPMFTSRVTRTVWKLALKEEDGDDNAAASTEIEFALDEGVLERNDVKLPISEVELELKAGSPQQLFDFALKLLDDVPMRIGNQSKAERGYALCMPRQRSAVKAAKLSLSKDMTVGQGLQSIIGNCLLQIQENETGVVQTHDPESVHQMRVGMRRLRSALGIFKELAPCPPALLEEIKWTANQLGAARDWEVLSGSTLAPVARAASEDEGMTALQQAALQLAQERRDAAAS